MLKHLSTINKAKPSTAKGRYITNAAISLTMSPSIILDNMELLEIRYGFPHIFLTFKNVDFFNIF